MTTILPINTKNVNGDYEAIKENNLNNLFKFRLIITYLPGLIVPVVASSTLEQYCIRVGVPYDAKTDMIYQNFMLRDWKDSIPEISAWSNEVLMSFCDWLWRNNKKLDGSLLKCEKNADISKKVSKESDENERLEVDNGFLLCRNHDKAFDKGYITFDDDGIIMISKELDEKDRIFLNIRQDMHIELTSGNKKYLNYHRGNLFKT